ncbi:thioredoxin-like protein [Phaeosphaeriaceae sp. PMI808]|nr:thioredoxin-like protein [Phaeosphaeriaceae sp. PMI808]
MTTTTTAAQDEFNELMRDKDRDTRHPEDRHHDSDLSDPESDTAANDYLEKIDTDDELDIPADMRSNYYMPSLRSEANTGPKGVIADAQAYELARKQANRYTWKKNNSNNNNGGNSQAQYSSTAKAWHEKEPLSDDDTDEGFMRQWRANRLKELGQKIRSRTNSPTRRIYGTFPIVDGEGYLDAIDKSPRDTIVVVYVFGVEPTDSKRRWSEEKIAINRKVEECMQEVAKRNDTVRFIRLNNADAEIVDDGVPAALAYKGGELFASVTPILEELARDSEISAVSLETVLTRHRML